MNMQFHKCEHGCPLKVRKYLHLSGFLFGFLLFVFFPVCIALLFNLLLFKYTGKREKLMEVLFASLLFCICPWVNKDTLSNYFLSLTGMSG